MERSWIDVPQVNYISFLVYNTANKGSFAGLPVESEAFSSVRPIVRNTRTPHMARMSRQSDSGWVPHTMRREAASAHHPPHSNIQDQLSVLRLRSPIKLMWNPIDDPLMVG
jgi:hypothetical protein